MKLLIGTRNKHKGDRFRALLLPLGLELLSLAELKVATIPDEDGLTPAENARKKAQAYFKLTQLPTLSIDYGLYLDKLPVELQPGLNVRRIKGKKETEVSDIMLLNYFVKLLNKYAGGESSGTWITGIALAVSQSEIYTKQIKSVALFTVKRSKVITPGEPLNSLQILSNGRYKSEMLPEEKVDLERKINRAIFAFVKKHLF